MRCDAMFAMALRDLDSCLSWWMGQAEDVCALYNLDSRLSRVGVDGSS